MSHSNLFYAADNGSGKSHIQRLKNVFFEQVRQDQLKHIRHRTSPLTVSSGRNLSTPSHHLRSQLVSPNLPNIAEVPKEEVCSEGEDDERYLYPSSVPYKNFSEKRTTFEEVQEIREYKDSNQSSRYNSSQKQQSYTDNSNNSNRVNYLKQPINLPEKITQASQPTHIPQKQPEYEYHERIMSPTVDRQLHINTQQNQPKPILKQNYKSTSQYQEHETGYSYQHYQDAQIHQSTTITNTGNSNQQRGLDINNDPRNITLSPQPRSVSTTFEMLDEEERIRIMQENLRKHRERSNSQSRQQKYPVASFNGPFFNLEEVPKNNNEKRQPDSYNTPTYISKQHTMTKEISTSEMELNKDTNYHDSSSPINNDGIVIWPPLPSKQEQERPRPSSAMARSMYDPERRREFERQKQMEYEAMRKREEEKRILLEKQMKAMQIQQQKLFEQQQKMMENESYKVIEEERAFQEYSSNHQQIQSMKNSMHETYQHSPQNQSSNLRVYETRPISAMSGENPDYNNTLSPTNNPTWKRTYVLDPSDRRNVEKNEIVTSDELLEKEQYNIDILKRREAFVEKPEKSPEIVRLGKRWQPPPDEPYVWPQLRKPLNINADGISRDSSNVYSPGQDDGEEYKWAPIVNDPGFRKENKNFTPENSPPMSPTRYSGLQTLDEVNRRQTKNVIKPAPDGSHRPTPVFKAIRQTPHGGFYPHAPNGIRVVKRRLHQSHSNLMDDQSYGGEEEDVQIIHERNYHSVDSSSKRGTPMGRSHSVHDLGREHEEINDWEKIYDLPAHSSTIQGKDVPHNVNLKKRLAQFESQANLINQKYAEKVNHERRTSEAYHQSFLPTRRQELPRSRPSKGLNRIPLKDQAVIINPLHIEKQRKVTQQQQKPILHAQKNPSMHNLKYRSPSVPPTLMSSSSGGYHQQQNQNVGSTHSNQSGSSYSRKQQGPSSYQHHASSQQPQHSSTGSGLLRRVDSRTGRSYSSTQNLNQQQPIVRPRTNTNNNNRNFHQNSQQRPASVTPMMASESSIRRIPSRLAQAQVSPIPPSYNTARPYVPRPLPDGYRVSNNVVKPNTDENHDKYITNYRRKRHSQVSEAPKKDDLDELAKLNKNLLERSKGLKKDFKLVSSEIIKTDPEPVPELYKEQLREMLESRISSETATSPLTLNATAADRSGYVTDASSTNWQFNNSFSPRSVVSINGCTNKDTPSILKVKTNHVEKHYNRSNSSVTNSILTETEPIVREFTETYSRIKVRNNNSSSVGKSNESGERIENLREHEIISSPAIRSPPSPPTVRIPLPPSSSTYNRRSHSSHSANYSVPEKLSTTIIELKDDKPRGIIKPVVTKPRVTETIKRIEETRRTEEVERRVQRKEKKHRSHRYHHNDHYMTEGHYNSDIHNNEERRKVLSAAEENEIRNEAAKLKSLHRSSSTGGGNRQISNYYHKKRRYTSEEINDAVKSHRSSSMNRNGMLPIGYYPGQETYHRSSTTRRENSFNDSPYYQMNGGRYGGSLSDSLRRGEVKYNPNGDIRESSQQIYDSRGHRRNSNSGYGMHKSYSTKDVFKDSNGGYYGSYYRNGNAPQPFVEFPPTLPRRHPGEGAPIPPPHRSASQLGMESHYRPISKSHSYADWSGDQRLQQHNNNYAYGRRHDEEMSRLENEFRDSLLIPLQQNGGVVNDHEHRVEQIPGGYEEYSRSVKGNAGKRLNRDGVPTDFREQSQSYSFRREQAH